MSQELLFPGSITKTQAQAKNLALVGSAQSEHPVLMKTAETTLNIRRLEFVKANTTCIKPNPKKEMI